LEYRVTTLKTHVNIKVIGPFIKNSMYTVSTFLKPFLQNADPIFYLDIDDLENDKEVIFYLGLINAFKKEIEQAGGVLFVKAGRPSIEKFFQKSRLDKIFNMIHDKPLKEIQLNA